MKRIARARSERSPYPFLNFRIVFGTKLSPKTSIAATGLKQGIICHCVVRLRGGARTKGPNGRKEFTVVKVSKRQKQESSFDESKLPFHHFIPVGKMVNFESVKDSLHH
jgi:hypothetical protein